MKYAVTAVLIAAALATPVLAKERHVKVSPEAAAAQASVPGGRNYRAVDPDVVIVNGQVVGRDPDPNVRLMLRRDPKNDAS